LLLKHGDSLKPPGKMRISVAVQYFSSASLLGFGAVVVAAGAVFVTAGAVAAGAAVVDAGGDTAFGGWVALQQEMAPSAVNTTREKEKQ
jgi:hypothetical protein